MNFKIIQANVAAVCVCIVVLSPLTLTGCSKRERELSPDISSIQGANNGVFHPQNSIADSSVGVPKYNNTLNIGEIEIAKFIEFRGYNICPLFEMSRDEVLEHFGLSTDFKLSNAVPNLHETTPKNGMLNNGKHGLHRDYRYREDENGKVVSETWGEVAPIWDNDEFAFENADCSQWAKVIFQRRYDNITFVPEFRSLISTEIGEDQYSTEPFYKLAPSIIAGVEMQIAKRNIGGYYAEFSTDSLCVGLVTNGISEEETVAILEYLAEYVGVARQAANSSVSIDLRVETHNTAYSDVVF